MPALPNLVVERVPIDALKPNPRHTRKVTPAQIRAMRRSFHSFNYNVPILVDSNNVIIAGHVRTEAQRADGQTEILAIRLEHLTPEQAQAFAIAENRLVETGEWDETQLGIVFKDLSALDLDFSLEDTGFSLAEIDLKIEALETREDEDADEQPIDPGPSVVRPGDLWTLGRHRLICGSSLERETYLRLMAGLFAAIIIADMPYNCAISGHVSSTGKFREFAMASGEMTEAEFYEFMLGACREAYDALVNLCVWVKPSGGMGSFYRSAHELIAVVKKGQAPHQNHVQLGRFGRDRKNTWMHAGANAFLRSAEDAEFAGQHATPKPVQLIADALMDASSRGDIVVDPFCGSGTTLIAAERLGRRCHAIELDPLYCDLIIRRWQRHTGQIAVREDGALFSALETETA